MAATTIGRESMTDGTTVWNVARIGSAIYDRVDTILSSNITFGGTVAAEGFGTHAISAGGTGGNILRVRNTMAGTGNYSRVEIGNDTSSGLATLTVTASTATFGDPVPADGLGIVSNGVGGMVLATIHTSATMRFMTGSTPTTRGTWDANGYLSLERSLVFTVNAGSSGPSSIGSGCFLVGRPGVTELTAANFVATDVYGMTPDASLGGQVVIIVNADAGHTYTLKHESASALSSSQRFNLPGDADVVLAPGEAAVMVYSTTISRWIACLG